MILFALFMAAGGAVGGQAVMDGVMLRNGEVCGLAVRRPDGTLCSQRLPWRRLLPAIQHLPLVRGFPILLETLVNGIAALNRSAALASGDGGATGGVLRSVSAVALAMVLAACLFVGIPHVLSLLMCGLGIAGDVDGVSFHIWDGLFKVAIFVAYVSCIALIPEISRLFACHGAEHKVVGAWETCCRLNRCNCMAMSRLHPRCGTTFVLFVVLMSMAVQAVAVPLLFQFWPEQYFFARQAGAVVFKLALIVPVSALAYEIVRFAASLDGNSLAAVLQAPGLALQRLTTREPAPEQIDVALVALVEALGHEEADAIDTPSYIHLAAGESVPGGIQS